MDTLDKIIMQEANTVTPDDYKRLTGTSLEDSMARMKEHMAQVKAKIAAEKKAQAKKAGNVISMNMCATDMRYAMPLAASAQKDEPKDSSEGEEHK